MQKTQAALSTLWRFEEANWDDNYLDHTGAIKTKCFCGGRFVKYPIFKHIARKWCHSDPEAGIQKIKEALETVLTSVNCTTELKQKHYDIVTRQKNFLDEKIFGYKKNRDWPQRPIIQKSSPEPQEETQPEQTTPIDTSQESFPLDEEKLEPQSKEGEKELIVNTSQENFPLYCEEKLEKPLDIQTQEIPLLEQASSPSITIKKNILNIYSKRPRKKRTRDVSPIPIDVIPSSNGHSMRLRPRVKKEKLHE